MYAENQEVLPPHGIPLAALGLLSPVDSDTVAPRSDHQSLTMSPGLTHNSPRHETRKNHNPSDISSYGAVLSAYRVTGKSRRTTTMQDYERVLRDFQQFVCGKTVNAVARRDVLAYRDHLILLGQSTTTATRKVGILKTLFGHAVDYEILPTNPAERVRGLPGPDRKPRIGFTPDDLQRIFHSPIYSEEYRPVGGGKEASFWLPLLALFTGARVEELAQLTTKDVMYAAGLGHYLNITDEAAHAHLKNASSRRRIPLHATVLDCGFLDYWKSQPKNALLFPRLKVNPRGRHGGYFSNFFSGYLRRKVGITDPRKVFHSFRHTFKDACRRAGIDEAVHDALTGHTTSSVGRRYGNEQYPLAPLFEAMQRYRPPAVDLSHLTKSRPQNISEFSAFGPVLCALQGIIIGFGVSTRNAATTPLIFAQYAHQEVWMDVTSTHVVSGALPAAQAVLVQAWIELRRAELLMNWTHNRSTQKFFPIDPLR